MPDIADMVDHREERTAVGVSVEPGTSIQVRIPAGSWPGCGKARAEVCQGQRMLWGAAHIVEPVAGMAGEPRGRRMLPLIGTGKALTLERLHHQLQLVFGYRWVRIPHRDGTRK